MTLEELSELSELSQDIINIDIKISRIFFLNTSCFYNNKFLFNVKYMNRNDYEHL